MRFLQNNTGPNKEFERIMNEQQQLQMSGSGGMMMEEPQMYEQEYPQLTKEHSYQIRQYDADFSSPFGSGLGHSNEMSLEAGFGVSGASGGAIRERRIQESFNSNKDNLFHSDLSADFNPNGYSLTRSGFALGDSGGGMMMEDPKNSNENALGISWNRNSDLKKSGNFSIGNSFGQNLNNQRRIFEEEMRISAQEEIFQERQNQGLFGDQWRKNLPPKKGGCKCSKTGCLKYYCECFKNGAYCDGRCGCKNCKNIPSNTKHIKKLHDYYSKKMRQEELKTDDYTCSCKKSFCENKYCPCHKSGRGCLPSCKCFNCKNVNGTKEKAKKKHHY